MNPTTNDLKTIKILNKNINIYVENLPYPTGTKIIYSPNKGSYFFGYFLGLDINSNLLCLTIPRNCSYSSLKSLSRLKQKNTLILDWHSSDTEQVLKHDLNLILEQIQQELI